MKADCAKTNYAPQVIESPQDGPCVSTVPATTLDYLQALYPPGTPGNLLAYVKDPFSRYVGTPDKLQQFADKLQLLNFGILRPKHPYLTVNTLDTDAIQKRGGSARGDETEVVAVTALVADVDAAPKDKHDYPSQRQIIDALGAMPLPSSLVILSGRPNGGLHVYWLLESPFVIRTRENRERIKRVSQAWQRLLKSKLAPKELDSTFDLVRVLRPIGTVNAKYGTIVSALEFQPDRRFTVEDFEAHLPEKDLQPIKWTPPATVASNSTIDRPRKYLAKIPGAVSGQGGHNSAYHVACVLVKKFALPLDQAKALMMEWNQACQPPWDEADIDHKLESAMMAGGEVGELLLTGSHQMNGKVRTPLVLESGQRIKAGDRGNIGEVVSDNGNTATIHFVSPEGQHAEKELPKSELTTLDGHRADGAEPPVNYHFITYGELMKKDIIIHYIVRRVLVDCQPMIISGPKKTLKTSLLLHLGLSIATGRPFLGEFVVNAPMMVGIMTGESGEATIKETLQRIAKSMESDGVSIDPDTVNLVTSEYLPQFGSAAHLDALREEITIRGIKVLIVDPAYMCIDGDDAGNLFKMGTLLRGVSSLCRELGCTLILCHHAKKNLLQPFTPPELEDIAWAGFQEFARQWILVNRRERYLPGSGSHRLWLSFGGSAGHGSLWGLNVEEGEADSRIWNAHLLPYDELKQVTADSREKAKEEAKEGQLEKDRKSIVQAMVKYPAGETKTTIRTGTPLSGERFNRAFASLIDDKTAVLTSISKGGRKTARDAYKLRNDDEIQP